MIRVTLIEHDGTVHDIEAEPGRNLMETAVDHLVPGILGECGGACICATCHVMLHPDWYERLPAPNGFEDSMLAGAAERTEHSRLGCQITLDDSLDGLVVKLPEHQV
jgi:2Fe-2S ferredoxin